MDIGIGKEKIEKTLEHAPKPPKYVEEFIREGVKFFGGVAPKLGLEPFKKVAMPVSAGEDDDNYYVYCNVAGIDKSSIEIYAQEDGFVISGERKAADDLEFSRKIQDEIEFGKLEAFVKIPLPKEITSLKTEFDNGMLKIVIPKYKGRKIAIE
jgi:HSP20 family protein